MYLRAYELSTVASLDVLVLVVEVRLALLEGGLLGLDRARQLSKLSEHQLGPSHRPTHPTLTIVELLDRVGVVGVVATMGLLGVLDSQLRVLLDEVGLVALLLSEALVVVEIAERGRRVGDLLSEQIRLLLDLLAALGRLTDPEAEIGDGVLGRLERVGIGRAGFAIDGRVGVRELVEALIERIDEVLGVALVGRMAVAQSGQLLLALGNGLVKLRETGQGGL